MATKTSLTKILENSLIRKKPEQQRKERMQELIEMIAKHSPMDFKKIVALFGLQTGLTEKTIISMLKVLSDADLIKITDGLVKVAPKV